MLNLCLEQGWNLENVLKERIVLIDGAMGTMVQREGLEEEDFRYNEKRGSFQTRFKGGQWGLSPPGQIPLMVSTEYTCMCKVCEGDCTCPYWGYKHIV